MRPRFVAFLAFARAALIEGYVTSTTSTWVVPHASRSSCNYPRRRLSRCRVQPSASIGSDNTSGGGVVSTERAAKPPLKVINGATGGEGEKFSMITATAAAHV